MSLKSELNELKKIQDEVTTSDLQGIVDAIARKYKQDSDKLLEYIYK